MSVTIGFLGMGIMGTEMARRLKNNGYAVTVWNRTAANIDDALGCPIGASAAEVVSTCDVTFAMLSTPDAARAVADDVVKGIKQEGSKCRGYVDFSTVDAHTSKEIGDAVTQAGTRFLESPVSGSKKPAIDGQLINLCAGDKTLFDELHDGPLSIVGKRSFFLGDQVGLGAKMKLAVNATMGGMMALFAENMKLVENAGLSKTDMLEVMSLGAMNNPMFTLKGPSMAAGGPYPPAFPLKHQQKDMRLALELSDELGGSLPVVKAANEVFVEAMKMSSDVGDMDFSAVMKIYNP